MADDEGTSGWTSPGTIGSDLGPDTPDTIDENTPDQDVGSIIAAAVDAALNAVLSRIVSPLYKGFLYLGIVAAGAITAFFMGSDQQLGVSEGSWPGLADLPMFGAQITIDVLQPVGQIPLAVIREVNGILVSTVAGFGVAAPIAMLILGAVEIVVVGWLMYRLAEAFQVEAALNFALGPFRAAWGLLR